MKLFFGPGSILHIPMFPLRISNPKCGHKEYIYSFNSGKEIEDNPPCICIRNVFTVPFGCWFTMDDHPCIVRSMTYEEYQDAKEGKIKDIWTPKEWAGK